MYLKSLEIHGFKSFPDKISLTFDKGLTAVVGPNGSGKSNIGDSVRWVLGEQSTKTLRGNKMEDVIFSGTVSRKPMGFASVTLNIDNSDGILADMGEEVAVTRKLYRNGDSEYRINGKAVRLKDINELFMDTGLGRDGYSIIGQGRIAEIVSAKSNERRDIFEEASGISKFKYRKIEAERKLSSAQENLFRLTDILAELESRIEPLRIQAQKAEKYLVLAEEKKHLEISVWVCRLDEMKKQLESLEEKILISRTEYEHTENQIAGLEKDLESAYKMMQECTMQSDEIRRKMIEEEQTASSMKSEIAVLENDIKHSESAVKSAEEDINNCKINKQNLINKSEKIIKNINLLESQSAELEIRIAETEKEIGKAESQLAVLDETAGKSGADLNNLHIRQSGYKFSAESAEKTIADETAHLEILKRSRQEHETKSAECTEKLRFSESEQAKINATLRELDGKLKETETLYNAGRAEYDKISNEISRKEYNLRERQQRCKILTGMEKNMEGFTGSVKAVLRGNIPRVYGTVAQNIAVSPDYAVAIETALGGAMQNIIVADEETAKKCIDFLKKNKSGRATFLPVTSVKGRDLNENNLENFTGFVAVADKIIDCKPDFRGIISSLLGRTVIAEEIDSAVEIAKKYNYRFRIVTLDGQIINSGGSFTGGSLQKSSGIITRRSEISALESEINKLSTECSFLRKNAENLTPENERLSAEINKIKSEISSGRNQIIRLNAEISGLNNLSAQLSSQAKETAILIEKSEQKIKSAEQTVAESQIRLTELSAFIAEAEKEISQEQRKRLEISGKINKLSGELSAMKISRAGIIKDIQAKNTEKERTLYDIQALENNINSLTENIKSFNLNISGNVNKINQLRESLDNLTDNSGEYLSKIKQLQSQHTEQTRKANEIQRTLKTVNSDKERLSGEMTRLEERQANITKDSDNIIKQLLESYELTRSEAVAIAEKIEDMLSANKKLSELKNKIRALGSVSVDSIDEYKEVSERYNFMSAQIADIQKSKSELEKIIAGLTEDMKRIFAENFNIINNNFKEIFAELFGGGKAELILTDPENVLTSGIEIAVAPPGKVIKNLISLSGGEQSFVAIAIYFAILKLRPAPFCILDEIDAALDEANVRRYAQYLHSFTDTTQFVLVTHRRSAMEEANVLYGVTMQEDGISKLLKMEQPA